MARREPPSDNFGFPIWGEVAISDEVEVGGRLSSLLRNPVLLTRLPIVIISAYAIFGPTGPAYWNIGVPVLNGLARWDTAYYLDIAANGYHYQALWAFRPFFPGVLAFGSLIFPWMPTSYGPVIIGFLWNLFAVLLAAVFFLKVTISAMGEEVGSRSLILLAVFPSSFFLTTIYPEATALLFVVLTIYFLEKKAVLPAALCGLLLGMARPEGFLIFVPFALRALGEHGVERARLLAASLLPLASLPIFLAISYLSTGSALTPYLVEQAWGKLSIATVFPSGFGFAIDLVSFILNLSTLVVAAIFVAYSLLRREKIGKLWVYYVWAGLMMVAFVVVGDVRSWARFVIILPPVLWSQAQYSVGRPRFWGALVVAYFAMMLVGAFMFSNWYPML